MKLKRIFSVGFTAADRHECCEHQSQGTTGCLPLAAGSITMISSIAKRREIVEILLLSPLYLEHLTQRERLQVIRALEQQGALDADDRENQAA